MRSNFQIKLKDSIWSVCKNIANRSHFSLSQSETSLSFFSLSPFFFFLIQQCCSLLPAHQILSYQGQQVIHPGYPYLHPRGGSGNQDASRFSNPGFQQSEGGHQFGSANDCCSGLQQRVNFVVPDPSKYDASINLQNVQISDSATYECKVKKTTVATRKVTVMVLGE